MKQIVQDIESIIIHTSRKLDDERAKKLHDEAQYWKKITRKSHWGDMKRLGKKHPDVTKKIEQIKSQGLEIKLRFDLTFPNDPS